MPSLNLEELKAAAKAGTIDTVVACAPDMQGRLMGKRFHAVHFAESAWEETHCCNYLLATDSEMVPVPGYAATSWAKGYGDYMMRPDMETLRPVPWLEGTALVLCDLLDHHGDKEVPHAPRSILRRQLVRLEEAGFSGLMASELEFFLFRQSYEELAAAGWRGMEPIGPYNEDYHIFQTTKEEGVMRAIRNGLHGAGIAVENSKGEADPGQEEINVRYDAPLAAADAHVFIKNACKEIAWQQGRAATFLAKWSTKAAGSSCHIHQSLLAPDGAPAFADEKGAHGMSETMRRYLAGLLARSRELTLFLAPNINSYKRFQAGTFAPTAPFGRWTTARRASAFAGRGTKAVRVECRIGGADLNPYLAMAALLAAGLEGIAREEKLGDEFVGDAYAAAEEDQIPKTLRDAAAAAAGSSMLREAFGEEVMAHYLRAAAWEQEECDRVVSDWEVVRGFERF